MEGKYLNLGCGSRFIESWVNIDFVSNSRHVKAHNLISGIPAADNSFDVVYHSHVLEHFAKGDGEKFIKECFRVLKPGGIIRVVVPELEQLARSYIASLEAVLQDNNAINAENYKWAVIELFDQMVRNHSGGEMGLYWTQQQIINEEFVAKRVGYEFTGFRKEYLASLQQPNTKPIAEAPKKNFFDRVKNRLFVTLFPEKIPNERLMQIGKFRSEGEIHQWMYDRYSLKELLQKAGFSDVQQQKADTSKIADWAKYAVLDIENGQVRKPDSLFMEAVKA